MATSDQKRCCLLYTSVKDGVDFESLDGTPAKIIFLIAAPNTEDNVHLQVLSKLSVMLLSLIHI